MFGLLNLKFWTLVSAIPTKKVQNKDGTFFIILQLSLLASDINGIYNYVKAGGIKKARANVVQVALKTRAAMKSNVGAGVFLRWQKNHFILTHLTVTIAGDARLLPTRGFMTL